MVSLLLMRKILQLFFIMFLGFILVKCKVVKAEESVVLSKISLYLITPCIIIYAFQMDFTKELQEGLLLAFVVAILIHILLIVIGAVAGRLFHLGEVEYASLIYSNAGNLIIPIVIAILGKEWVIYSCAFVTVQLVFIWTHCKMLFSEEKKPDSKKILLNVNILAIITGLILLITGLRLPKVINETIGSIGDMVGPVAMLITGMLVAKMNMKLLFAKKKIYLIVFMRLIFCPGIILLLMKLSNVSSFVNHGTEIILVSFLATATPAASTVTQFAILYDKDAGYSSAINIVTTLLCIITMPLFVALYYM